MEKALYDRVIRAVARPEMTAAKQKRPLEVRTAELQDTMPGTTSPSRAVAEARAALERQLEQLDVINAIHEASRAQRLITTSE